VDVADPVYVHIGPPKTGTTYLQAVLWSNRATLKDNGMLVPGRSPVSQFHAAIDLLGRDPTRVGSDRTAGSWETLVEELRGWDGPAVISHENLGFADQADRAKLSLEAKEIHIVFTAREFSRVVPAMWQEQLKNRSKDTWAKYVEALAEGAGARRAFWHQYAGSALLTWAAGLPAEQIHIVTVPPAGSPPSLLWERFASVLNIDPATYNTDVPRANDSLGVVESAFLRLFNLSSSELGWEAYRAHVKHFLAPQVLATRADATRIRIQPDELAPLEERAHQLIETIESRGFHVVGDLTDLKPPPPPTAESDDTSRRLTDDVSDAELLAVAFDAVAGLVDHAEDVRQGRLEQAATTREVRRELRETRRRLDELRAVNRRLHERLDITEYELDRSWPRRWISRFIRKHAWAGRFRDFVLRRNRRSNDDESS
jgi:hypothetical protein